MSQGGSQKLHQMYQSFHAGHTHQLPPWQIIFGRQWFTMLQRKHRVKQSTRSNTCTTSSQKGVPGTITYPEVKQEADCICQRRPDFKAVERKLAKVKNRRMNVPAQSCQLLYSASESVAQGQQTQHRLLLEPVIELNAVRDSRQLTFKLKPFERDPIRCYNTPEQPKRSEGDGQTIIWR
jgi:hypothetical protein